MPTWDLGLGIAGLRVAARQPHLLHHHQLLGPIRAVRVGAEDEAPVHPGTAEVIQASLAAMGLAIQMMTISLSTVQIP